MVTVVVIVRVMMVVMVVGEHVALLTQKIKSDGPLPKSYPSVTAPLSRGVQMATPGRRRPWCG